MHGWSWWREIRWWYGEVGIYFFDVGTSSPCSMVTSYRIPSYCNSYRIILYDFRESCRFTWNPIENTEPLQTEVNEWKNGGNDGMMKDNEWRNKKNELDRSLLILSCCSDPPPIDLQTIFSKFSFLFFFFFSFFFLKATSLPPRGFHHSFLHGHLKRGFHLEIFLFLFFFLWHHWVASRGFQPNIETQVPHGGFQLTLLIFLLFFFFSLSMTWWGRIWDLLHHHHCFYDTINELLLWQWPLVNLQSVPINK